MEEEYIKELFHKRGKRWVNIGESYKMYAGIIEHYKRGKLLLKKKNLYIYILVWENMKEGSHKPERTQWKTMKLAKEWRKGNKGKYKR